MKNLFVYSCCIMMIALFYSCEKELMEQEVDADIPIVESYIAAGDTTLTVKVSKLIPFTTDGETQQLPISSLNIVVEKNGTAYQLVETGNAGTYSYTTPGLVVQPGESYTLHFTYNSKNITTTTSIPDKPTNAIVSPEIVYLAGLEVGEFGQPSFDPITISWDNPTGDYYFLKIEYIETAQDLINENFADQTLPTTTSTEVLNNNAYNISPRSIYFFGTHRIIVYKINQEYADLFETLNQSSQNLTDPVSHIENAWGLFTGLNADTLYMEVEEI